MIIDGKLVKIWYGRNPEDMTYTGQTTAVVWDGDNRHVGISQCSAFDQFSKPYGRKIAINRAFYTLTSKGKPHRRNGGEYYLSFNIKDPSVAEEIGLPVDTYFPRVAREDSGS